MKGPSTVNGWFHISEIAERVYEILEPGHVQFYLVIGATRSALMDTGLGFGRLQAFLPALCATEIVVLNTHWHFDHIGGNAEFTQLGISALEQAKIRRELPNAALQGYLHLCQQEGLSFPPGFDPAAYAIRGSQPTFLLADGEVIDLGGRALEVLATPGHTHGSLSFLDAHTRSLFCGDLLYQGDLYAQFDDSDLDEYRLSLRKLSARCNEFDFIWPAHNAAPLSVSFVETVLTGLAQIQSGTQPYTLNTDWGQPVQAYDFAQFRVLAKSPGTTGVKLFE